MNILCPGLYNRKARGWFMVIELSSCNQRTLDQFGISVSSEFFSSKASNAFSASQQRSPGYGLLTAGSEFTRLLLTHFSNWFHCDLQWLVSYSRWGLAELQGGLASDCLTWILLKNQSIKGNNWRSWRGWRMCWVVGRNLSKQLHRLIVSTFK